MRRSGGLDIRWLAGAILAIEIADVPLFAIAFGNEVLAVLIVRLLLTTALVVFTLKRSAVAQKILGALRMMTFCIGFIMAIGLTGAIAWTIGALAVADMAAGTALLLLPSRA